ncbi:hypothetical protein SEVIR_1G073950v4 [Setaria viridis]
MLQLTVPPYSFHLGALAPFAGFRKIEAPSTTHAVHELLASSAWRSSRQTIGGAPHVFRHCSSNSTFPQRFCQLLCSPVASSPQPVKVFTGSARHLTKGSRFAILEALYNFSLNVTKSEGNNNELCVWCRLNCSEDLCCSEPADYTVGGLNWPRISSAR